MRSVLVATFDPAVTARALAMSLMIAFVACQTPAEIAVGTGTPDRPAPTPLATPTSRADSPRPSPTATAAASILRDRVGLLWVQEPTGLRIRPETGGDGSTVPALPYSFSWCSCAVSPDGTRLAYWTSRATPDNVEMRIVDLARPGSPTTIYRAPTGQRISSATWSSDGTGILFASEGTHPPGSPVGSPPNPSLLVIEAGGGAARTLDRGAGVYVPLGWDRTAGIAAAALSGEGGYMTGYVTVRTSGDPAPKRAAMRDSSYVMSVEVSSDQRYALGIFFQLGQAGRAVRWWKLADFAAMTEGPRVDSLFGAKWRPGTAEIGYIAAGTFHLFDVELGTTRSSGALPSADYAIAAFRHDGSAVAASSPSQSNVLLEIASGRSENLTGSGQIAGAFRIR